MPLYPFRCADGHTTDLRRPVVDRDLAAHCARCGLPARRQITAPQRPVVRPLGYHLHPGDRGYWRFETADGVPDRPKIAPFAVEEHTMRHPPIPTDE